MIDEFAIFFWNMPLQKETDAIFTLARMEIAAVLYFLRKGVKLHFYSLGTIFEENMRVSRGVRVSGGDLKMRSILKH